MSSSLSSATKSSAAASPTQPAPPLPTVADLLSGSAATPEFRASLEDFASNNRANARVKFDRGNPPVKVLRVLMGLLDFHRDLAIDSVEVRGTSGCSDYRGTLLLNGGERRFRFVWDCAWRASQLGWEDPFGYPDQMRAAREWGYRCFEVFEEER